MTNESLLELRQKVKRAEAIKSQIDELKKIDEKSNEIKLWGVCIYFDEECENRLYADLPSEDLDRFIDEFIINKIKILEKEFASL